MVSFTSLFVVAIAGFSAVSGLAIRKRDLSADIVSISAAVETLDSDIKAIDPQQDPNDTISLITGDIYLLNTALLNASINENLNPISDDQIPSFKSLLSDFKDLIDDIDAQVPIIEQIPGLDSEMVAGLTGTEGFTFLFGTTVATDISAEHQGDVVEILALIKQGFANVKVNLSFISTTSSNSTSSS